ncbi:MAG: hypothetical protein K5637_07065 [Lachnospiraceae bacterium]|nr:hypothetical protein [Lachnospiraceae bacterium]
MTDNMRNEVQQSGLIPVPRELVRKSGLQYVLDRLSPMSPFGAEILANFAIFADGEALVRERRMVSELAGSADFRELRDELDIPLMRLRDIRGSLSRCARGEDLLITELFELKVFVLLLRRIREIRGRNPALCRIELPDPGQVLSLLDPSGKGEERYRIEDDASPELKEIRKEKRQVESLIYAAKDSAEKEKFRAQRDQICGAEEAEERRLLHEISAGLSGLCGDLTRSCGALGHIDILLRKADMLGSQETVIPERAEEIIFRDMINPEIAAQVEESGGSFVPVSIELSRGAAVITGANMGGKTVSLKSLALNTLLAMGGYPVYARNAALPDISRVMLLSGNAEDHERGLSSFGGEVVRIKDAVDKAGPGTLLLLDEPAGGTNPDEGAAIVRGLVTYLNGREAFSVIATHYDRVAPCAGRNYRIKGLQGEDPEKIKSEIENSASGVQVIARHMNYGLYPCSAEEESPREALLICRLLGLQGDLMECIEQQYSE